jgi:hypothetical protein
MAFAVKLCMHRILFDMLINLRPARNGPKMSKKLITISFHYAVSLST